MGAVVRCWLASLRIRVSGETAPLSTGKACVFAFWHGQQMLLAGARARPVATLVSWSRDGAFQAGVMWALGVRVVRGSSSRGGALAFRRLLKEIEAGHHAAFAADGPRGPAHWPKPGAAACAHCTEAALMPVAAAASCRVKLTRAWDRFEVPLPFSRVAIVFGSALDAAQARADPARLAAGIDAAGATARDALRPRRWRQPPTTRLIVGPNAAGEGAKDC